jgi:hypothetical protein
VDDIVRSTHCERHVQGAQYHPGVTPANRRVGCRLALSVNISKPPTKIAGLPLATSPMNSSESCQDIVALAVSLTVLRAYGGGAFA